MAGTVPPVRSRLHRLVFGLVVTAAVAACTTTVSRRELAEEYYNLGNAFYDLGRYDESFRYYSRAIELDPDLPAVSFNLARLHIDRGEYDAAALVLEGLRAADPENILIRESDAYLDYVRGEFESAYAGYRSVADEYPGRTSAAYNLARVARKLGREGDVIDYLERAATVEPEDRDILWELANAYWVAEQNEDALAISETFRELAAGQVADLVRLAESYFERDYHLLAVETFDEAAGAGELGYRARLHRAFSSLIASDDFTGGLELLAEATSHEASEEDEVDLEAELEWLLARLPADDATSVEELLAQREEATPEAVPSGL